MKKNILLKIHNLIFIFAIVFGGAKICKAEEYEIAPTGCYSVEEAACIYNYKNSIGSNEKISINFKNNSITSINFINSKNAYNIYGGTISYNNFCNKSTKEFGCPEKAYIYLDLQGINRRGQAYFIDASTSNDLTIPHEEITLLADSSFKQYYKKTSTSSSNNNTYTVKCAFNKNVSAGDSSKYQLASPSKLNYVQYSDGTFAFVDADNTNLVIKINAGSITCNSAINMCFNVDKLENNIVKEYSIGCSAGTASSTGVQYTRTDIFNQSSDNSQKQDGTNNSSALVTPSDGGYSVPSDAGYELKVNYNSFCGNENGGVKTTFKILGMVVYVMKLLAPLLIIVFGVLDYFKAVTSSDEEAVNKATTSLIRRIVSGVIIILLPTLIWGILNLFDITDGIHDLNNNEFGACTKCLLLNECK